ncbi:MAG: four helix bundle protein [Candidatus Zixiibacteriota bacterium]
MRHFEELTAWQVSIEVAKLVYELTREFPKEEIFGLTSQIRRASVSISSNIAEGFGRRSPKDKERFYMIALGSLLEVKSQLYVAIEVGIITKERVSELFEKIESNHRLINALAKSLRKEP